MLYTCGAVAETSASCVVFWVHQFAPSAGKTTVALPEITPPMFEAMVPVTKLLMLAITLTSLLLLFEAMGTELEELLSWTHRPALCSPPFSTMLPMLAITFRSMLFVSEAMGAELEELLSWSHRAATLPFSTMLPLVIPCTLQLLLSVRFEAMGTGLEELVSFTPGSSPPLIMTVGGILLKLFALILQ